jgi:hypothetical protein
MAASVVIREKFVRKLDIQLEASFKQILIQMDIRNRIDQAFSAMFSSSANTLYRKKCRG